MADDKSDNGADDAAPAARRESKGLPRGPKGGRTTRTRSGMVRKSLMLGSEEAQALRRAAFETERSEAEIVREAVRRLLGLTIEDRPTAGPPKGDKPSA